MLQLIPHSFTVPTWSIIVATRLPPADLHHPLVIKVMNWHVCAMLQSHSCVYEQTDDDKFKNGTWIIGEAVLDAHMRQSYRDQFFFPDKYLTTFKTQNVVWDYFSWAVSRNFPLGERKMLFFLVIVAQTSDTCGPDPVLQQPSSAAVDPRPPRRGKTMKTKKQFSQWNVIKVLRFFWQRWRWCDVRPARRKSIKHGQCISDATPTGKKPSITKNIYITNFRIKPHPGLKALLIRFEEDVVHPLPTRRNTSRCKNVFSCYQ